MSATCLWRTSEQREEEGAVRQSPQYRMAAQGWSRRTEPCHWNARSPPAVSWRCCSSSATSATKRSGRPGVHSTRVGDPLVPGDDGAILAGLEPWMREGAVPLPASTDAETDRTSLQNAYQGALFWGAVERLAKWREAGRAENPESVLIDYLADTSATLDPAGAGGRQEAARHS